MAKSRTGPKARDLEDHEVEESDDLTYLPPSNLPDPAPRDGWAHRWVRCSALGTPDNQNVSMRMREGWEPVRAEDYPELQLMNDREAVFEDSIEIGGLVLCQTSTEHMAKRDRYYAQKARRQVESVDHNYMKENDPRMPLLPTERSTRTTFGTGRSPKASG